MTTARRPPYAVLAGYYDEVYGLWRDLLGPARDEILRVHHVRFETLLTSVAEADGRALSWLAAARVSSPSTRRSRSCARCETGRSRSCSDRKTSGYSEVFRTGVKRTFP